MASRRAVTASALWAARERLNIEADVLPGGHLIALAQPEPLARYLLAKASE